MGINYMTPVITAFDKNGNIDERGNENVYEFLINGGVDGIILMGSTGEFFSMTKQQKKQLIDIASNTIKNRTRFLVGTSSMYIDEIIELSNYAKVKGAEAVLIIPPYYFAPCNNDIYKFYDIIASSVNIDILLYNYPERTGYDITPEVTLKLINAHKNIVGYKDTTMDMQHTRELIKKIKKVHKNFQIYSGFDDNFIHNILSGGDGNISALSNIVPEITSAMVKAVKQNDFTKMQIFQRQVDELMDIYSFSQPFIMSIKKAMVLKGIKINDYCKQPFNKINNTQTEKLRLFMQKHNIIKK